MSYEEDFLISKVRELDARVARLEAAASAAPDASQTVEDELLPYPDWSVQELRDELAGRELSTTGKKMELIARLEEDDAETEAEPE